MAIVEVEYPVHWTNKAETLVTGSLLDSGQPQRKLPGYPQSVKQKLIADKQT